MAGRPRLKVLFLVVFFGISTLALATFMWMAIVTSAPGLFLNMQEDKWQEYRNDEFGFSFRYPVTTNEQWVLVEDESQGAISQGSERLSVSLYGLVGENFDEPPQVYFAVTVFDNPQRLPVREAILSVPDLKGTATEYQESTLGEFRDLEIFESGSHRRLVTLSDTLVVIESHPDYEQHPKQEKEWSFLKPLLRRRMSELEEKLVGNFTFLE